VADRTVELDFACLEAVAAGIRMPNDGAYISVNLSPRTLESNLFQVGELKAIFQRHGIGPERVVLELTERERVEDIEQLRRNVDVCRRAGMRLAADDVGAGNAGLRLLSEVHFDIVKIDLSLIQGGTMHDPSHGVLRALQELATQWDASVVAEGVETAEQLRVIRQLAIGAGQGYLLSRPSETMRSDRIDLDELETSGDVDDLLVRAIRERAAPDPTSIPTETGRRSIVPRPRRAEATPSGSSSGSGGRRGDRRPR
jgi:EAL domain-containing protein (putative c-di-GMP-specific phosphodiesterase class I)